MSFLKRNFPGILLVLGVLVMIYALRMTEEYRLQKFATTHETSNIVWTELRHEPEDIAYLVCPKEYLLYTRYGEGWLSEFRGPVTTYATCLIPKDRGFPPAIPKNEHKHSSEKSAKR